MKESCGRLMLIITKAEKLSRPGNPGKIQESGLLGTELVFWGLFNDLSNYKRRERIGFKTGSYLQLFVGYLLWGNS